MNTMKQLQQELLANGVDIILPKDDQHPLSEYQIKINTHDNHISQIVIDRYGKKH